MKPEDFDGQGPRLMLESFFVGQTRAWGIFQDRFGTLRQQFTVDIQGEWDEGKRTLTLTEDFHYADGSEERRVWTIEKLDDNSYRATTGDVIGSAAVKSYGNVVNLNYRMQVAINGKDWALDFDDWMFRQDENVVINRAEVSKWGLKIGTATIFFHRENAVAEQKQAAG